MPRQFSVVTAALPRPEAWAVAEALEAAPWPEAAAVSLTEADEAADLWRVEAVYETEPEPESVAAALARAGQTASFTIQALPEVDWVRATLAGLEPVRAGRFLVHGSHDRAAAAPSDVAVEIDAGLAFGTGHHDTTRGCLVALDAILKTRRPRRILDVGCGTGVLAIAAARALRRPALATDIDPVAVAVARANARLNGVAGLVRCLEAAGLGHPAITAAGPFDLIFANILARPLVGLAPAIARALADGGHVVLSGLTADQERQVLAAYAGQGLARRRIVRLGAWSTLVLARNGRARAG